MSDSATPWTAAHQTLKMVHIKNLKKINQQQQKKVHKKLLPPYKATPSLPSISGKVRFKVKPQNSLILHTTTTIAKHDLRDLGALALLERQLLWP